MAFRFVHTADLHLDAPLRSLAFRDPDLAREVGVASRAALGAIVDLCLEEKVDFLLIAGDLWDGAHSSTKTPRYLKQELLRLHRGGIRCFILRGNHDAMARQTGELDPPDLTHVFEARAGTVELSVGGHPVAIHGLSFRDIHAPESLLPRYPKPVAGAFNIGMMHTSLNGSSGHDPYAPCSLPDLVAHGYDYWALGHIHLRAEHRLGGVSVVMPGTPQGRDIGEAGPKSVSLITVGDDNSVEIEERNVASLRFEALEIDLDGVAEWSDLMSRLSGAIYQAAAEQRRETYLVLRPILRGHTALAARIRRDQDRLADEARSYAADAGVLIDKLVVRLEMGQASEAAVLPPELLSILTADLAADPALREALSAFAAEVMEQLPVEARELLDPSGDLASQFASLQAEGVAALLASLAEGEGA